MNKTERAKAFLKTGRFREALSIITKFRMNFTMEEKRTLQIAYECLVGHSCFYKGIGIDTKKIIAEAKEIIRNKYNV